MIGLHFFSPANVMPLLEVVRTARTSAATIATAMELSRPLRKTPVLARVCYGFIGNRMMEGYAREAQRMVLEGATPRRVDAVLERWGMAMGILGVFDMAGIDVGVNVHRSNAGVIRLIRLITRPTSRCTRPDASGRRTARATTAMSPVTGPGTTTRRRSRSCARPRSGWACRARSTRIRKSWSGACIR